MSAETFLQIAIILSAIFFSIYVIYLISKFFRTEAIHELQITAILWAVTVVVFTLMLLFNNIKSNLFVWITIVNLLCIMFIHALQRQKEFLWVIIIPNIGVGFAFFNSLDHSNRDVLPAIIFVSSTVFLTLLSLLALKSAFLDYPSTPSKGQFTEFTKFYSFIFALISYSLGVCSKLLFDLYNTTGTLITACIFLIIGSLMVAITPFIPKLRGVIYG